MTIRTLSSVLAPGTPLARDDARDRELLSALAAGAPHALAEMYDRHAASLFRHALVLCRRRPDAEDLVHTVFMKLARTGAPLLGVRSPASYLHRTLHTAWIDGRRRAILSERTEAQAAIEHYVTPTTAEAIDVMHALDGVPAEQREVIVLHVFDGFSFREIGRQTGVSLFTAAARYRLGLRKMRATLDAYGERIDEQHT